MLMETFSPQMLILMVGDNDIKDDSSSEEVSSHIKWVMSELKVNYPFLKSIVLTQILPRHHNRWVNMEIYNSQAMEINRQIKSFAEFKWAGFSFNDELEKFNKQAKLFRKDGVHLLPKGYYVIYKQLRHMVVKHLKQK